MTKKQEMHNITEDLAKLQEPAKQYILGFLAGLESAKANSDNNEDKAS